MILVTGATGMIGRALVNCLLKEGLTVRAHGRSKEELERLFPIESAPGVKVILEHAVCDFAKMTEDDAKILTNGCSVVVHNAGLVHQANAEASLYFALNLYPTEKLCDAASEAGIKQFIFMSSSSVYGNRATEMIEESSALQGDTLYAASKISCENYLRSSMPAPSTVLIRPSLVFGEGDRGNMLSLIRQVLSGKYFLIGEGSASKSLIYAADLADAILALIKSPRDSLAVYNIANPDPVSVKQLSQAILDAGGSTSLLRSVPAPLISIAAGMANLILGSRSPLSADRLAKLTRNNSVSVASFQKDYGFKNQFDLSKALQIEIDWARREKLI